MIPARCGTCPARWHHAERRSHCTACHRTFAGHTLADRHRVNGTCRTDADLERIGAVRRERRTADGLAWVEWGSPPPTAEQRELAGWHTPSTG